MHERRRHIVICLLVLALAPVGAGWAQTAGPAPSGSADLYRQAVSLLNEADQQMAAGHLSAALARVKQANEIFTRLQKDSADKLAGHQLSDQDSQQLAINQKLGEEAQGKADSLLETAAAKKKQAAELSTQGKAEASEAAERESRDQYLEAQKLSIKSAIYALRNQEKIFRFLAP